MHSRERVPDWLTLVAFHSSASLFWISSPTALQPGAVFCNESFRSIIFYLLHRASDPRDNSDATSCIQITESVKKKKNNILSLERFSLPSIKLL